MHHRQFARQPPPEAFDQLRRQTDFRNQHHRLPALRDLLFKQLQIHLRLAAAGNAFKKARAETGVRQHRDGRCLRCGQFGA